jgi:predicted dehydrogenase
MRHELRAEDTALGLLQFSSGAQGITIVDELTEHANFKLELHFARGMITLGGEQRAQQAIHEHVVDEDWWWMLGEDTLPPPAWAGTPILNAAQDLVHCLATGDAPRCTGEDGRAALEVIMGFYESERRGHEKVTFPFDEPRPMLEVMKDEGRY